MSTVQGMLSSEQLQTLIEGEEIDTILVVFLICMDGLWENDLTLSSF